MVGNPAGAHIKWDGSVFTYPDQVLNPPQILAATLSVNDDTTDDNYTAGWTLGPTASDALHYVRIYYYKEGVLMGTVSGQTPSDETDSWVDSGEGDGVSDLHNAVVQLYNITGGAILSEVTTRSMQSTL